MHGDHFHIDGLVQDYSISIADALEIYCIHGLCARLTKAALCKNGYFIHPRNDMN